MQLVLGASAACWATSTGHVRCHDRETGHVLRDERVCDGCRTYLHVHDELVVRVSPAMTQAFEPTSGRIAFEHPAHFDPVGRWGRDLLLQRACTFVRQRVDGSEAWRVELDGADCRFEIMTDAAAFVGRCRELRCEADGERIDAETGEVSPFLVPERVPSVAADGVLVLQQSRQARAWDVEISRERWRRPLEEMEVVQAGGDGALWILEMRSGRYQPIDAQTGADHGLPFAVRDGTLVGAPQPSTGGVLESQVRIVRPDGETMTAFVRFDPCGPPTLARFEGFCGAGQDGIALCATRDEIFAVRTAAPTR
jgi:nitrite reductase/ring-hydroxylating ferredoxin subunit